MYDCAVMLLSRAFVARNKLILELSRQIHTAFETASGRVSTKNCVLSGQD